jgi:dolichol-phosphate mannosyltransferase
VDFVDALLEECARYEFESVALYVVLDRVSRDETRTLLDEHGVRRPELHVVWAPETSGVADAYVRGYREALADGCDWILEIDGGFSHDPSEVGLLFDAMVGGCDCVFGSRFHDGGAHLAGRRRRALSRGGTALTNLLLGTELRDMTGGFELFRRSALERVLEHGIRSKGPFFQAEIKAHCRHLRVAEVPIHYRGASHRIGAEAIVESLVNLARLFRRRLAGAL